MFHRNAGKILNVGYQKYKNGFFRAYRSGGDIMILSTKYANELKNLPEHVLNQRQAIVDELLGTYTGVNLLAQSPLHGDTLLHKLSPSLGRLLPRLTEEIHLAIELEFPKLEDEWTSVNFYSLVLRIVARVTSRILVDVPLCRNEEWLELAITYTENVFETVHIMKYFPAFMHPFIVYLVPSYWRLWRQRRLALRLLMPLIEARRNPKEGEQFDDYLQWMMDAATGNDGDPDKLATRQLIITLGSIHSTTMGVVHTIYDLATYTDLVEPLRAEINKNFFVKEGAGNANLSEMWLLDSIMKESQRFNPPGVITFHRYVRERLVLKDGTVIPKGTELYLLTGPVQMDPENTDDPDTFDGYRWLRRRQQKKGAMAHKETYISSLHFGYGRGACPGRFWAEKDIKCIVSYLLKLYDFKFPGENPKRPENLMMEDRIFPNQNAQILLKRRPNVENLDY